MIYKYAVNCFKTKASDLLLPLVIVIVFFSGITNLPAQNYWMQKGGGASADEGYSISIDDSNNTYTTGYFTGTASFGSFNLTASGVSDIFVAKTNSSGVYKWAVKAGDGGSDRGLAIATDANGNSYVTGYYYGTATFGIHSITSAGLQDVFVAKYDRNGNVLWVVSGGGTESDIGNAIAVDNNGNVVITGQFTGTATFGTFTLNSTANNINVFTAKLNGSTGTFMWAESGVGKHTDRGLGVACDPAGNIYITGQFTDTITFNTPHYSPLFNAIFVVKYNTSGAEQWITTAGAGTYNIANAIAVDHSSNVYITGNFTGTLTFYAQTTFTLTETYANRIFLAKYDQNANLQWDVADGSSNPVTSNSIALDGSGNPYIIGNFDCIMNSYADRYGQGTFNSVGYWDIFNAEYSSASGAWQWSRQIGGHGNNYGYGLAVSPTANLFATGSFDQDMIITENPSNYLGYNTFANDYCTPTYCSDPDYGYYAYFNTTGNLDIFIAEPINLNRQTYDYYDRSGGGCSRPIVGVCVGTLSNVCQDTVKFCTSGIITAIPRTCVPIGPVYTYLWSTGATTSSINVSTTRWYSVKQTSVDGCSVSKDSTYVIIHPAPAPPCISDNVVINTNSTNPLPIRVCDGPVILTGCNYSTDSTWYWTTPTDVRKDSIHISVGLRSDSGYYCFNVVNRYGCTSQTCVWVAIDSALPRIKPKLTCLTCRHDTAFLCKGNGFTLLPYDSITNRDSNPSLCIPPSAGTSNRWSARPSTIGYSSRTYCPDQNTFVPDNWDSGWYKITDTVVQSNVCGTHKYVVKDSIFARIYPVPIVTLNITGSTTVCPGDSEWIVGSGNANYTWSNSSTNDSIYVGPGYYYITATVTNSHGCTTTGTAAINITNYLVVTPTVTSNPSNGVICPGDSVEITCTGALYQKYQWYGPSGPLTRHTASVYVTAPGSYYCVVSDSTPCPFSTLSNTVIIESYSTPFLQLPSGSNICPGDSIVLQVEASNDALIVWQAPLIGNSTTQTITSPGTYSVKVTACGITTTCTVTITESHPFARITATPSKTICTAGDSIYLAAAAGMANYLWNPGSNNSQNIYVKSAATYTLTATDAFGCTATADVVISPPLRDSIALARNISCRGSSTGTITLGVIGGALPYTFSWSPPEGSNSTASNLSAGSYSVTVIDANGCTKTASATLSQPATLLVSGVLSFSNVNCFGNSNGIATATASGGEPSYSYLWSPGGETTVTATGLTAGTYTLNVIDSAGCSETSHVTITQPLAIAPLFTPVSATCLDDDGSASVSVNGGTSPYSYLWNPGGSTNTSISGLTPGTYSITITDSHGCIDSTSVTVGLDTTLYIVISGNDSLCKGQSVTLNVSGGTTYLWCTGSTSTNITLSLSRDTTLWVKGTTGICTDSIPYPITIYRSLLAFMPRLDSICPGTPVTINVKVLGGKPAYTYLWNNGITSDSPGIFTLYPTASTTYIVNITDACNYKAKDSIYVKVLPKDSAAFTLTPDTIQGGHVITFTNNSLNATTFNWNFGDGGSSNDLDPTHEYLNPGVYQVVLTGYGPDGCPDTAVRDVYVTPEIYIPNVFTPNGDGINDIFYFTIQGALCFHANIYNRWGVLVYELNSEPEGWPGTIRQTGEPAADGTYYYILNYCDYKNVSHELDGFITLIRNKQ